MPRISIIIPVYNSSTFLPYCLDSVLRQTATDLEILCIDNNSTDNSLEILRQYAQKDPRIRVFQQPLQGQSAARNMGLDYATGQYIGFVDSDDEIDPCYYSVLYQAAIQTQADVVCTGCQEISPGHIPQPVQYQAAFVCPRWNMRWRANSAAWAKLYSRKFIEQNALRFANGLTWEDVLWVLQTLYKANKVAIVRGNGYFYKTNLQGTVAQATTKNRAKTLHDVQTIFQLSQDFISQNESNPRKRTMLIEFITLKLFFSSLIQNCPALLHKISAWTRWKQRNGLLLAGFPFCFWEYREYHEQFYCVLRLFGLKIRLWKLKYPPLSF